MVWRSGLLIGGLCLLSSQLNGGGVDANSSGLNIPCDVDNPTLGTPTRTQPSAATQANNATVRNMWWVTPPQWAQNQYTLRAGDADPTKDLTSYTPGQYIELTLRANVQDKQLTGLLMYAVNANNQRIGEWQLPPRQAFQIDPVSGCVTHSNADPKNYKTTFRLKIPKGTGTVTVKALIKYGLAFPSLDSTFMWPNSQHLVLTEGAAPTNQVWFQGVVGQSCNTVCKNQGMGCDLATMQSVGTSAALLNVAKSVGTCWPPMMRGCSSGSPATGTDGCFYQDPTCSRFNPITDWVQIDPCAGVPAYDPKVAYQAPNNCCQYGGFKWCSNYYTSSTPTQQQYGAWTKLAACAPAGGYPTPQPQTTPAPRTAAAIDCSTVKSFASDGNRLCACSSTVAVATGTDAPTQAPTPPTSSPNQQSAGGGDVISGGNGMTGTNGGTTGTNGNGGSTGTNPTPTSCIATHKCSSGMKVNPVYAITAFSVILTSLLSPFGLSSSSIRSSFMVLIGILMMTSLPSAHAHNWLTSPSRANKGGFGQYNGYTSPPGPPKGTRAHVQVAAGQRFQMEWASGHGYGSSTYLVVLKAADEVHMLEHTFELLDDYINSAPAAASTYMSDSQCIHITNNGPSTAASLIQPEITSQWPRPSIFRPMPDARAYSKKQQYTNQNGQNVVRADKRVQYTNPKYPWIISVHRFALDEDLPDQMDGVLMEIPKGYPSGQYVVQYQWRGYYDVMDVNVLDVTSTDLWGSNQVGMNTLDKYNHCLYNPNLNNYKAIDNQCFELGPGDTVEACANACFFNSDPNNGCDAVQIAPATLNTTIVKYPGTHQKGTSHLPASCVNTVKNLKGDPRTTMLCYTLHAGDPPLVGPQYKMVYDPEDPVFYNTCYIKKPSWQFAQTCTACVPPAAPADFRFADKCISCADMNRNFFTNAAPRWLLADVCEDCNPLEG